MTLLVWSTDIVGRLGLWPEDKQRRPGVGSMTTWLYHNYYYDSSYKYGHPMSVMEKVAVRIHALNEKVTNDPRVTATILPIASGLTLAQNFDIEGKMFLRLYKGMSTILPALFLPKSILLLLLFHWIIIVIELPFAISLSTSTKVSFLLLRLWQVTINGQCEKQSVNWNLFLPNTENVKNAWTGLLYVPFPCWK